MFERELGDIRKARRKVSEALRLYTHQQERLWDALVAARAAGVPQSQIAAALGVTQQRVSKMFKKPPPGRVV